MFRQIFIAFAFLFLSQSLQAQCYPPSPIGYPSYAMQNFDRNFKAAEDFQHDATMAIIGRDYRARRYAEYRRDQVINRSLSELGSYGAFQGASRKQVEDFALRVLRKYTSSEALRQFVTEASQISYNGFLLKQQEEISELSCDFRALEARAKELDIFYQGWVGNRPAYDQARRLVWQAFPQAVLQEMTRNTDFQSIEWQAKDFAQKGRTEAGDVSKPAYHQAAVAAFQEGFVRFQQNTRLYDLKKIANDYDFKYRTTPAGWVEANFYRQVRDLAISLAP